MINTSNEYKEKIRRNRIFLPAATITLADRDSTVLKLTKTDFMINGISISDGTSDNDKFTIGGAIINSLQVSLNNFDGKFSGYDFTDAVISHSIGLQLSKTEERFNKGVFTVDESVTSGSVINIVAYDYMKKFDTEFSNIVINFPCTNLQLLQAVCSYCGVNLATMKFLNSDFIINTRFDDKAITCREIVSWIAQMAGCFARCNTDGALELKWYDIGATESTDSIDGGTFDTTTKVSYQIGDDADGGDFAFSETTDYDGGIFTDMNRYHHIYSLHSETIGTDDVVITGVQVKAKGDTSDDGETVLFGFSGYVIEISDNPLIQKNAATTIANSVGAKIVGMKFRPLSISTLSDPSIEAGDMVYISDRKGNSYLALISNLSYTIGGYEKISCDAETPSKNSSKRFSASTKAVIEARKLSSSALKDAKEYADQLFKDINTQVEDINTAISGINTLITIDVADNIISESEKASIRMQLQNIEKEKLEADAEYHDLYNNMSLSGTAKTNLANAYADAFVNSSSKYTLLLTSIDNLLKAASVPQLNVEIQTYYVAYSNYKTSISVYTVAISNATLAIGNTYVDGKINSYDMAVQQLTSLISQGFGMYTTQETQVDGSTIYYLHNKATKEESDTIWKLTSQGLLVSKDGGTAWAVDKLGNALFNTIQTRGISFDWAQGGTLKLGGADNTNGYLELRDTSNAIVQIMDNTGTKHYKNDTLRMVLDDDNLVFYDINGVMVGEIIADDSIHNAGQQNIFGLYGNLSMPTNLIRIKFPKVIIESYNGTSSSFIIMEDGLVSISGDNGVYIENTYFPHKSE